MAQRYTPGIALRVEGVGELFLSSNIKTGWSLNVSLRECAPTKLCKRICYARECRGTQVPPMSWAKCRARYDENSRVLMGCNVDQLRALAQRITVFLQQRGRSDLRICGCGDLFPQLVVLCASLVMCGVRPWGFSKKPAMLRLLGRFLGEHPPGIRFFGSVDESMPLERVAALVEATAAVNSDGQARLAYLCMTPGWLGRVEIDTRRFKEHIAVVFGFHRGTLQTKTEHPLACPATEGQSIHCAECRRCIDAGDGEIACQSMSERSIRGSGA